MRNLKIEELRLVLNLRGNVKGIYCEGKRETEAVFFIGPVGSGFDNEIVMKYETSTGAGWQMSQLEESDYGKKYVVKI